SQRDGGLVREAMLLRQQDIGSEPGKQWLPPIVSIKPEVVDEDEVESPVRQAGQKIALQAVLNMDLHIRITLLEARQQPWQIKRRDGFVAADLDLAGDHVAVGEDALLQLPGHAEQIEGLSVEAQTCRRERDPACMVPDEELGREVLLQRLDGQRDRWLRNVEAPGRFGHAAALDNDREIPKLSQRI